MLVSQSLLMPCVLLAETELAELEHEARARRGGCGGAAAPAEAAVFESFRRCNEHGGCECGTVEPNSKIPPKMRN